MLEGDNVGGTVKVDEEGKTLLSMNGLCGDEGDDVGGPVNVDNAGNTLVVAETAA